VFRSEIWYFVVVLVSMMLDGGLREGASRRWRLKFVQLYPENDGLILFILVPRLCGRPTKHLMWQKIGIHHKS